MKRLLMVCAIIIAVNLLLPSGLCQANAPGQPVGSCPFNVNFDQNCNPIFYDETGKEIQLKDGVSATFKDANGNSVVIFYDKNKNLIQLKNSCDSTGEVRVRVLGRDFMVGPCGSKELLLVFPSGVAGFASGEEMPNEPVPNVKEHEVVIRSGGDGELTGFLSGGKAVVLGQGQTSVNVGHQNIIILDYDGIEDLLHVINPKENKETVHFNVLGINFDLKPGEEKSILLSTADDEKKIPDLGGTTEHVENPNEGREPISPVTA